MKRTSSGRQNVPIKALLYGDSGTGKTTFASHAPGALILDLEHGSSHLDVDRCEVDTFDEVLEVVRETKKGTLVIDSLTELERMCVHKVLGPNRKPNDQLATFGKGFGQGNELMLEYWRELLSAVERCPANVIMIAHSAVKSINDPTGMSYDRWQLHLNEKISNATQRMADYILFARFAHETRQTERKSVGITGERVLETDANAAWIAKHRGNIPNQLPLSWDAFAAAVETDRGRVDAMRSTIAALIAQVTDYELQVRMSQALADAGDSDTKLAAVERRVQARIDSNVKEN